MAELLVRVKDKVNADVYLNSKCTKRFDVIVAQPDGWGWGKEELKNPDWRILKIPALPLSEAEALCAPELPIEPTNPSKTLHRRAFKLDLGHAAVPQNLKNYIADDTRIAATFAVSLGLAQIRNLKTTKAPSVDPSVIGGSPVVIG